MKGLVWFIMLLLLSPAVYASPEPGSFPNIPFNVLSAKTSTAKFHWLQCF
jgi:hypothetical protein